MRTRRQVLQGLVVGGLGVSIGCRPREVGADADFNVGFLTDPHVFAEKGAAAGCARAVSHAMAARRRPELIITGGDLAFDIMGTDIAAADAQYDLFDAAWDGVRVPVHHGMGNHDCLGVAEAGVIPPDHELFGKGYFLRRFGLDRAYYSFDHEGWHFVVLDTVGIVDRTYRGWVDAEQLAWLEDDLAASGKPTVVVGHIPLFSNFIEWRQGTAEGIPGGVAVVNAHEVAAVLERHAVKLVLAGHLHIVESFRYKGIEFGNVGAISGNWWNGLRDGFEEGYTVLSFKDDTVSWRYVDYGWEVPVETAWNLRRR